MLKSDLYGALSRAYCSEKNRSKVLDTDLIESMADEILLLYTQNRGSLEPVKEVYHPRPGELDKLLEEARKESLKTSSFHKELESLINRYSCENESDTPDWVLAEYIERCLTAFNACINMRERWYGRELGKNINKTTTAGEGGGG